MLCVDDMITFEVKPKKILRDKIGKSFKLKESSIGLSGQYLNGKIQKVLLENGIECWTFGSSQYVQKVNNVKSYLSERNLP